jgi:A/G-specific adenine glycosylase
LAPLVAPARVRALHEQLLPWFSSVRRDLPWRATKDPYAVWLSEIMLQQTRVETVIPYYERFLATFPTVTALAAAPTDQVMSMWSGLGYYRRARMLHEAAMAIAATRGGVFPTSAVALAEVRGVGRYTAGAIASIAFGERTPLVDGNVARVLSRLFALEDDVQRGPGLKKVWALADALVPEGRAGDWNEALMELGATTCIPRAPRCLVCPVRGSCEGRAQGIEASLPRLRPKKEPAVEQRVSLVAKLGGKIVLARRRREGLFGGLWEPPTIAGPVTREGARAAFRELLGVSVARARAAGRVVHTLSHRRLETEVLSLSLARPPVLAVDVTYDAVALTSPGSFAGIGVSTFARKVLAQAGIPPR